RWAASRSPAQGPERHSRISDAARCAWRCEASSTALRRRAGTQAPREPRISSAPLRVAQHPGNIASAQVQLLEEVVALVIDDDEGREIHDLDAPDRFHAEFGIFKHLDLLDAVLSEVRRGATDRAEIEAAIFLAGLAHGRRAVALRDHYHR